MPSPTLQNNDINAFITLLKAGLWETNCQPSQLGNIDFDYVLKIAQEQSVVGLIAAGLEHVSDVKVPKEQVLLFVGDALQIEQCNIAMNEFLGRLYEKLEENGIYAALVKGQGIAQCYERPLWRACGDVDLLLDKENYERAKTFFSNCASRVGDELKDRLHQDYTISSYEVELHGTMRTGLWGSIDKVIDDSQRCVCSVKDVRIWDNGNIKLQLPHPNHDVIFVFTHILQHYYQMGIGLRQICDWCRLLWTFRESIDIYLLQIRLKEAGIMTEWKAFAALAVDILGMPAEAMPFYTPSKKWCRKADRIFEFILETGNMGHNRDMSYFTKYPYLIRKGISVWKYTCESFRYKRIFLGDTVKTWCSMVWYGIKKTVEGK